jgi:glutaredoxin 2
MFILAIVLLGIIGNASQALLTSFFVLLSGDKSSVFNISSQLIIILFAGLSLRVLFIVAGFKAGSRVKDFKTMIWQKSRVMIQRWRR